MVILLFCSRPILSVSKEEQPDHYSMLKNSDFRNCMIVARWPSIRISAAGYPPGALSALLIGVARNWPTPLPKFPNALVRRKTFQKLAQIRVFQRNQPIPVFDGWYASSPPGGNLVVIADPARCGHMNPMKLDAEARYSVFRLFSRQRNMHRGVP